MVLLKEFENNPKLSLHVILFRHRLKENILLERNGVHFHILKALPAVRVATNFWLDTFLISRLCRELKPDVIHAWGSEKAAITIATRLRFPFLGTLQGLLSWYQESEFRSHPYERYVAYLEVRSLRSARSLSVESQFGLEYLKRLNPKVHIRKIEHAPNWIFHQVQRAPRAEGIDFLAVGSFGHRKGSDLLFFALEMIGEEFDFTLTLVSDQSQKYLDHLLSTSSQKLRSRIHVKINLSPLEIAKELERCTLFLHPARFDNSPNAVKEAVVAGVPVVAARVGGIPEYVLEGENGLLFDAGNGAQFAEAILSACRHPLFGKGQVNSQTLHSLRDALSPSRMAERFFGAYEEILSEFKETKHEG